MKVEKRYGIYEILVVFFQRQCIGIPAERILFCGGFTEKDDPWKSGSLEMVFRYYSMKGKIFIKE